jgi:hypothetical protein
VSCKPTTGEVWPRRSSPCQPVSERWRTSAIGCKWNASFLRRLCFLYLCTSICGSSSAFVQTHSWIMSLRLVKDEVTRWLESWVSSPHDSPFCQQFSFCVTLASVFSQCRTSHAPCFSVSLVLSVCMILVSISCVHWALPMSGILLLFWEILKLASCIVIEWRVICC